MDNDVRKLEALRLAYSLVHSSRGDALPPEDERVRQTLAIAGQFDEFLKS